MEAGGFEPSRFSPTGGAAGGASPEWHDRARALPRKGGAGRAREPRRL